MSNTIKIGNHEMHNLYGTPLSLYTGKARSYLIKAGIDYREVAPTSAHYRDVVLPEAGNRTIPTLETAEGKVIRDGTAIIDHFEGQTGGQFSPRSPKQKILSLLFDVIGAEGLLRPAMHYRWNFPDQNAEFIAFHFESMVPDGMDKKAMAAKTMEKMQFAGQAFGATPENFALIESHYETLLDKLNVHFSNSPYLLGGKPCIGDFGMIAPLYAHLGRDPAPLQLMQTRSVRVFRWVERMNRPDSDIGEFGSHAAEFHEEDEIPGSLLEVLRHIAEDFIPETEAAAICINQWLASQADLAVDTPIERGVGMGNFEVRGQSINALAQPYRFYLLQRLQSSFEALSDTDKIVVIELLEQVGMKAVIDLKLNRTIGRENNLEVWK